MGFPTSFFYSFPLLMNNISLTILGSGSAIPAYGRYQAAHLLSLHNKKFLIDCGEGTQARMAEYKISTNHLDHIFISHLHGDHCFGLIGLISTMAMHERRTPLFIHSHKGLEDAVRPMLLKFCEDLSYSIFFVPFEKNSDEIVYEDQSIIVSTIPLVHTVPSAGFLIREKEKQRHIIREKIDFFKVPIKQIPLIKKGEDFITDDNVIVPNSQLTTSPSPSFSYAYCSDTLYCESIIPYIKKVDLLFHESTYLQDQIEKAKKTLHTTALQAANIARKAEVKQLLIGHYSARYAQTKPLLNESQKVFPNTIAAYDGLTLKF